MKTQITPIREILQKLLDCGFTRTKMAEIAGVSVSTISRVLTGEYMDMDYTPAKKLEIFASQLKYKKVKNVKKRKHN
jgi:nitrogen regulatory protein PII